MPKKKIKAIKLDGNNKIMDKEKLNGKQNLFLEKNKSHSGHEKEQKRTSENKNNSINKESNMEFWRTIPGEEDFPEKSFETLDGKDKEHQISSSSNIDSSSDSSDDIKGDKEECKTSKNSSKHSKQDPEVDNEYENEIIEYDLNEIRRDYNSLLQSATRMSIPLRNKIHTIFEKLIIIIEKKKVKEKLYYKEKKELEKNLKKHEEKLNETMEELDTTIDELNIKDTKFDKIVDKAYNYVKLIEDKQNQLEETEKELIEKDAAIEKLEKSIEGQNSQLKKQKATIEKLENSLKTQKKIIKEKEVSTKNLENSLELQKLKSKENSTEENNNSYITSSITTLLIYPNFCDQTSNETKELLQQNLRIETMDIKVKNLKTISRGGIALTIEKGNANEIISAIEESNILRSKINIKETSKRLPRLLIQNLPINLSKEAVQEEILKLIPNNIDSSSLKLLFPLRAREGTINWVLESNGKVNKFLITEGYIFFHWNSYKISHHYGIIRCFNCCTFGHKASECPYNSITCAHCSYHHATKVCTSNSFKCINCLNNNRIFGTNYKTDHSATSSECSTLKLKQSFIINRTNYEI